MTEKYYLCDGEPPCCSSSRCYVNGGGCIHTSEIANSISEKYPEFASTYFVKDEIGNFVEHLDPASIMRTFMAGNPTPDLTRLATV